MPISQAKPHGHSISRGSGVRERARLACSRWIRASDSAGSPRGASSSSVGVMQRTLPYKVKEVCVVKLTARLHRMADLELRAAKGDELGAVLDFWRAAAENDHRPADTPAAVAALHLRDPDALILAI